jgi:hypothetical protein
VARCASFCVFLTKPVSPEPVLHLELFAQAVTGKVFRDYPGGACHEVLNVIHATSRPGTTSICNFGSAAGILVTGSPSSRRTILQPCAIALAL